MSDGVFNTYYVLVISYRVYVVLSNTFFQNKIAYLLSFYLFFIYISNTLLLTNPC